MNASPALLAHFDAMVAAEFAAHPEALDMATVMWPERFPALCKWIDIAEDTKVYLTLKNPRTSFNEHLSAWASRRNCAGDLSEIQQIFRTTAKESA